MNESRSVSVVLIGTIVLLAIVGITLSASGEGGRADLAGSPSPLGTPGETAAAETFSGAVGKDPGIRATPLPRVENSPQSTHTASGPNSSSEPSPAVLRGIETDPPGLPRSLAVPALGIDATIVPVGLEPDGTMQIPGGSEAGWYLPGRLPGAATGSAVIAAHVDYEGEPGVFIELRRLELGSEVSVTDANGTVHRFTVVERYQVGKDDLPMNELFRSGGDPVLTLVTCGGAFDPGDRSYSDNIVVRAVPLDA